MDTDFPYLDETVVATARYLETLVDLSDDQVREPSVLPGWTRAHVVTHVSRNADALCNVLHGAQSGDTRWMYASQEERDANIDKGADRSAAELRDDAVASAGRWQQAANELHVTHLDAPAYRVPGAEGWPVRRTGMLRWTEVEVHHADLGLGYTAADWPAAFVAALMKRRQRELAETGPAFRWRATDTGETWSSGDGPEVEGAAADILWWLLGRGSGDGVTCSSGSLPEIGPWA